MRAIGRFTVRPVLPDALASLGELAQNLRWSWHPETQAVFREVDAALWESTGRDPVKLLGAVGRDRFEQLASDDKPAFVSLHHPPADLGLGLMAPILLREPEPLELVIMKHPHVIATLVGHAHTACATTA